MSQPWIPIDMGRGFEDGINFYGEFNEQFANEVLERLQYTLAANGTPCYCLRLKVDEHNNGYFSQFGNVLIPDGSVKPPLSWSDRIPLDHLVIDFKTWPPVAMRLGPPEIKDSYDFDFRRFLQSIQWQVMIRIQSGENYVGYFKLIGVNGSSAPSERDLRGAACSAKVALERLIAYRNVWSARTSYDFQHRLSSTAEAIIDADPGDTRRILRYVADMLTCHLGVGWNRAACFGPADDQGSVLRCLWAQGGDGTQAWGDQVQNPLAHRFNEVQEIIDLARHQSEIEDPYFRAAVAQTPLEVRDVYDSENQNLLARLWRAGGQVRRLPSNTHRWEMSIIPIAHMSDSDRRELTLDGPIAAGLYQSDPWITQVERDRPGRPIFVSQNGQYFLVPWISRRKPIAIWLLDNANWKHFGHQPNVPSLALTKEVLDVLGPTACRLSRFV